MAASPADWYSGASRGAEAPSAAALTSLEAACRRGQRAACLAALDILERAGRSLAALQLAEGVAWVEWKREDDTRFRRLSARVSAEPEPRGMVRLDHPTLCNPARWDDFDQFSAAPVYREGQCRGLRVIAVVTEGELRLAPGDRVGMEDTNGQTICSVETFFRTVGHFCHAVRQPFSIRVDSGSVRQVHELGAR